MIKQSTSLGGFWVIMLAMIVVSVSYAKVPAGTSMIAQEDTLTTEDLIELALRNHYSYQKHKEDVGLLHEAKNMAYAQFLPSINARASYGDSRTNNPYSASYSDPETGKKLNTSITKSSSSLLGIYLSQNLFDGGYKLFNLEQAKLYLQNAALGTKSVKNQIIFNVKSAVNTYMAAIEFRKVAREVLEFRKESLRLAKARFNNGDVIELDVLQAEIDLGDAENELLSADLGVENACEALNLVVGIDLQSRFPIKGDFTPDFPALEMEMLVSEGLKSNPDYNSLDKNLQIKNQAIKIASSSMLPTVDLTASLTRRDDASDYNKFVINPEIETRAVSLGISWYIFNRMEFKYLREQAVVDKRKAMWDKLNGGLQLESGIRNGMRDLTRLQQQIEVTAKNRELARRQLKLEQERYRLGASSQLNLRSAQVTFIQAENEHITKVFEFLTTRAQLEQNIGRSLEEVSE